MRELDDAKAADRLEKRSLEETHRALFTQLVQRAVSDTLVRMTRDEDDESSGQFHPFERSQAPSKIRTVKWMWRDMEQESTENRHGDVEKSPAGNMKNVKT